jgi:hypothetical protein
LEERLKLLMQELGNAINETLSDSDRIAEAIGESSAPVMTFSSSSKPRSGLTNATKKMARIRRRRLDGPHSEATGKISSRPGCKFLRA